MKMRTVMFAAVSLGLMSAGASPVAKVGETEYETLDEAVAAGGEIRLVADATVEWLEIKSGVTVVLDLAGHTLTGTRTDCATFYVNGGSLTIDDSVGGGRITHEGAVTYDKHVASEATAVSVSSRGEFLLLNGTICDCEGDRATIANYGKFCMSGGSISNCMGTVCGGVQNSGDFVMAGGVIEDCRGQFGAIANNGWLNNVEGTMLMTGGLITRCYSTAKNWTVFAVCSLTIMDGTIDDCGEKTLGGSRRADTIVIMGGRFAGGIPTGGAGNLATITGGVFSQSVRESVSWEKVLPLGYACVANTDDLTAKDYPWTVKKVFTPIAPGETVEGIVAADEESALAAVRVNITDKVAESYNQERLIRKVATREADGTWTVSLDIDTSAEDYIDLSAAMSAISGQLASVSGAEPGAFLHLVLPAAALTKGLYYRVEECVDIGSAWEVLGCDLATGRDLSYALCGSDDKSRFFRVCQSLTR